MLAEPGQRERDRLLRKAAIQSEQLMFLPGCASRIPRGACSPVAVPTQPLELAKQLAVEPGRQTRGANPRALCNPDRAWPDAAFTERALCREKEFVFSGFSGSSSHDTLTSRFA